MMKVTQEVMEQRVQNGIKWLDKHFPGWEAKVNLERFNVNGIETCPCAYAAEEYYFTVQEEMKLERTLEKGVSLETHLGFMDSDYESQTAEDEDEEMDKLTAIWKREIKKLKEERNSASPKATNQVGSKT